VDTDFKLIKQMRQGDEAAFDLFIHKYYLDILRYCTYHCHDSEEAKDLTQDTFLRFFSGFASYSHRGKAKNYLYTIAGNLCKNYYRQPRGQPLDSIGEELLSESPEDALSTQITVKAVESITVSDEIKLKIKKRIEAEIDSCNKAGRQNKAGHNTCRKASEKG